jgi:hypothetical protein
MTATALDGNGNLMRRMWSGERDDDGHRTWTVEHQVTTTDTLDGPSTVMACSDLPQIGDMWVFGNDNDTWAFCWPTMKVDYLSQKDGEKQKYWKVQQKFSTKPMHRCNVTQVENPLSEPFIISGNFVKYTKEVAYDRYQNQIRSSSLEQVHGAGVEFDFNRMSVKISWNVSALNLGTISTFVDTVNDSTLWGMARRCVKLSNYSFERILYGVCTFYYRQNLEFDIDWNTFDRSLMDEGFKALHGEWRLPGDTNADMLTWRNGVALPPESDWKLLPIITASGAKIAPDRNNPQHFTRYKDRNGEIGRAILDGNGEPVSVGNAPLLWAQSTQYRRGTIVVNPSLWSGSDGSITGNVYKCVFDGTSNSSGAGPTGTGTNISDGTVKWDFMYTANAGGQYGPGNIIVSYYPQSNFLLLGIPTSL